MAPNRGGNATPRDLTSSQGGKVALTATVRHEVDSGPDSGVGTQPTDGDTRPPDCGCLERNDADALPCWPCYRDGFDTPNPNPDSDADPDLHTGDDTGDLSANRFDVDLDAADDAEELAADQYAEEVARQWGTPEEEWWP